MRNVWGSCSGKAGSIAAGTKHLPNRQKRKAAPEILPWLPRRRARRAEQNDNDRPWDDTAQSCPARSASSGTETVERALSRDSHRCPAGTASGRTDSSTHVRPLNLLAIGQGEQARSEGQQAITMARQAGAHEAVEEHLKPLNQP